MKVTTVGVDLAKNVIQVHGVDEQGKAALKKQLKRDKPIRYEHKQHLIEARAFARRRQPLAPELIEPQLLPQLQREPACAPLPRPLKA